MSPAMTLFAPGGERYKQVPLAHPFLLEAKDACERFASDSVSPVGACVVKEGRLLAKAGNGFNRGPSARHVCPRIVMDTPHLTNYELCPYHETIHATPGHDVPMAFEAARRAGHDLSGAEVYCWGHWTPCPSCRELMHEAGITFFCVAENADVLFARENIIKTTIKTVYIAGSLTNLPTEMAHQQKQLYEALGKAAEELGCRACIPHLHNRENQKLIKDSSEVYRWAAEQARFHDVTVAEVTYPSLGVGSELAIAHAAGKKIVLLSRVGAVLSSLIKGIPSVVYHVEYETPEQACRRVQNVLRQL